MSSEKKGRSAAAVAPDDLAEIVREAVHGVQGLSGPELRKRLPVPYQKFKNQVDGAVRALVRDGALLVFKTGPTARYYSRDPLDELDALARDDISEPMTKAKLKAWVSERRPGYDAAFSQWLGRAIKQRVLFAHGPVKDAKSKYGREPKPVDVRALLATVLKALRAALPKADERRVPRQHIAEVLLAELGLATPHANGGGQRNRSDFLAALHRLAADDGSALLSIRDLRRRLHIAKRDFDDLALCLQSEGLVTLHYHDYPTSLSESERDELVADAKGTHYVGIALKGDR
jgi:hypothetical protein